MTSPPIARWTSGLPALSGASRTPSICRRRVTSSPNADQLSHRIGSSKLSRPQALGLGPKSGKGSAR